MLRDATLVVSYTFNNTLIDEGPQGINGTGINIQYSASGRFDSAVNLTHSSYVQASGLVYLGTDGHPFSVSLWIRPANISGGTITHVSRSSGTPSWSMPMLGLNTNGQIIGQICNGSSPVALVGPVVAVDVWTHVALTYSKTNQFRLWINGTQSSQSSRNFTCSTPDAPVTMTLGSLPIGGGGTCGATNIVEGQYLGLIDEFQLYSRTLSSGEIWNLAT